MSNPEDTVSAAFVAFQSGDGRRLVQLATKESLRNFARATSHQDLDDSEAAATLERATADVPRFAAEAARCVVLGHVAEGPNVAHVVFRLVFQGPEGSVLMQPEPLVATTQRENGDWKLVLDEWAYAGMPGFRNTLWEGQS